MSEIIFLADSAALFVIGAGFGVIPPPDVLAEEPAGKALLVIPHRERRAAARLMRSTPLLRRRGRSARGIAARLLVIPRQGAGSLALISMTDTTAADIVNSDPAGARSSSRAMGAAFEILAKRLRFARVARRHQGTTETTRRMALYPASGFTDGLCASPTFHR
jgi:hypothetical protein